MNLTIPTRLVKISDIENNYICFFFKQHCVLSRSIYCSKRYAYSIKIKQNQKRTFYRTQGNQAFVMDGEIWTQP